MSAQIDGVNLEGSNHDEKHGYNAAEPNFKGLDVFVNIADGSNAKSNQPGEDDHRDAGGYGKRNW